MAVAGRFRAEINGVERTGDVISVEPPSRVLNVNRLAHDLGFVYRDTGEAVEVLVTIEGNGGGIQFLTDAETAERIRGRHVRVALLMEDEGSR